MLALKQMKEGPDAVIDEARAEEGFNSIQVDNLIDLASVMKMIAAKMAAGAGQ